MNYNYLKLNKNKLIKNLSLSMVFIYGIALTESDILKLTWVPSDTFRYINSSINFNDLSVGINLNWAFPFFISSTIYSFSSKLPLFLIWFFLTNINYYIDSFKNIILFKKFIIILFIILLPFAVLPYSFGLQKDSILIILLPFGFKYLEEKKIKKFLLITFLISLIRIPFAGFLISLYFFLHIKGYKRVFYLVTLCYVLEIYIGSSEVFYNDVNDNSKQDAVLGKVFIFLDQIPPLYAVIEFFLNSIVQLLSLIPQIFRINELLFGAFLSIIVLFYLLRYQIKKSIILWLFLLLMGSIPYAQVRYYITAILSYFVYLLITKFKYATNNSIFKR